MFATKDNFKTEYTVEKSKQLKEKYPNKIPVIICESKDIKISRKKFLVEKDITCGQLIAVLRSKVIDVKSCDGIYMFFGEEQAMMPIGKSLNEIFETVNTNGFIKVHLAKESTFG